MRRQLCFCKLSDTSCVPVIAVYQYATRTDLTPNRTYSEHFIALCKVRSAHAITLVYTLRIDFYTAYTVVYVNPMFLFCR
jgi:hypothetical protein